MENGILLLADGGGTTVEWAGIDGSGDVVCRFKTSGINAVLADMADVRHSLEREVLPMLGGRSIGQLRYYGAGCLADEVKTAMTDVFRAVLRASDVVVDTDLMGAAVGLCGDSPGIVCILGTGSNSCYYDGVSIVDNVSPLGFILGDEGSGAVLGRRLVSDVLKRQLPDDIRADFMARYQLTTVEVIKNVYKGDAPSRYLASFAPFLCDYAWRSEIRELVISEFVRFFERNVSAYKRYGSRPVNFVGSIAVHFSALLAEAAHITGFELGTVVESPVDGLIGYYAAC